MKQEKIFDQIRQDLKDITSLMNYDKYGISNNEAANQANGIKLNINDHLDEFIELLN